MTLLLKRFRFKPENTNFERRFNGSLDLSSNLVGVDLENDLIYLPNHYFVTGEKNCLSSQGSQLVVELTDTLVSTTAPIDLLQLILILHFLLKVNDFLESDGRKNCVLLILKIMVFLIGVAFPVEVLAGSAVTFFRLNQGVDNTNTLNAIGIAQTFIAGVGNTDKLWRFICI